MYHVQRPPQEGLPRGAPWVHKGSQWQGNGQLSHMSHSQCWPEKVGHSGQPRCRHSTSCWLHARGAARRGGKGAQRGSRRGRWAPWQAASTMVWLWAMCEIKNSMLLPMCAGVTPCWAAAVAAWALTSISGSLGCHRRWQTLCEGVGSLGLLTLPRAFGGR